MATTEHREEGHGRRLHLASKRLARTAVLTLFATLLCGTAAAHADGTIPAIGVNSIQSDGILLPNDDWNGLGELDFASQAGVQLYRARIQLNCVDPNHTGTFNFTVKATGAPTPAMSEAGALPQGLTWTDNGNGTATLAGTPGVNQGGVYDLSFVAASSNGKATQAFTLTVAQAPAVTSRRSAKAVGGHAFSFTFKSTGFPVATITRSGSVRGMTFTTKSNGTATLSGKLTKAGTYKLAITAKNSVGSASQTFTLKVS